MFAILGFFWAWAGQFVDVPDSHWAAKAVNELAAEGLLKGYPDGRFRGG